MLRFKRIRRFQTLGVFGVRQTHTHAGSRHAGLRASIVRAKPSASSAAALAAINILFPTPLNSRASFALTDDEASI